MATQKVKPGPGAPDGRDRRPRRQTYGKVGTYALVTTVVVVVAAAAFVLRSSSRKPDAVTSVRPSVLVPAVSAPTEAPGTETAPPPAHENVDYLLDLKTDEVTPLPKSIVGTEDLATGYAVSPDGSRLAYLGRDDTGDFQIFVANLDGTGVERVTAEVRGKAMPSGEAAPAWSPGDSKIAYVGRGGPHGHGNVYLLDLLTGVPARVTDDPRDGAQSPTFSPDGESIIYSAHRKGGDQILAVPVAGGASEPLMGGDAVNAATITPVELSPDGSLLSYACGDEYGSDLCLANADGTDARVLVAGGDDPSWSPDGMRIAYWDWQSGVHVVDVETGEDALVSGGAFPTWLDGHTLIVETDECNRPHDDCGS